MAEQAPISPASMRSQSPRLRAQSPDAKSPYPQIPEWTPLAVAPTAARKGTALASLSLPDLKIVERRNNAYAEAWRQRVTHHATAQIDTVKLAERRKREADVIMKISESRAQTGSNRSRTIADEPLRILTAPMPSAAIKNMHADCMRREEIARRAEIAKREATLAADRAETLEHLKQEATFRVQSNLTQNVEVMRRRRVLEQKRNDTDRAVEIAARAKEKAAKERQKASQAAELQQLVDERRAAKQAAEKREEAKALAQRKAREAAAEAKEAMMRERRDYMERCKEWTLAKKLEKAYMHAESLASRAEDLFNAHVLKYDLRESPLLKDGDEFGSSLIIDDESNWRGSQPVLESTSTMSIGARGTVVAEGFAEAELERLHTKMVTAQRRMKAAQQALERARRNLLTEGEMMMLDAQD